MGRRITFKRLPSGDPSYITKLDRAKDGVACD
ncbi:excalibur calcium-binding domain-containing protein [Paenibacillus sp. MMO-58]